MEQTEGAKFWPRAVSELKAAERRAFSSPWSMA
jgi:hypothetical protein